MENLDFKELWWRSELLPNPFGLARFCSIDGTVPKIYVIKTCFVNVIKYWAIKRLGGPVQNV
uniref:Uncharacterized protein n=1 Tax=Daphnia galeata TaxID=27404 RepID=A0A8J2WRV4_9CRUS|nr:unnamed protein product [Daphnia galeata]